MTRKTKRPRNARKLSTLDDFLSEQGKREEFEAVAMKEAAALPLVPSPHSPSKTGVNALLSGEGIEALRRRRMGEG
jgi:hypothetical protein